MSFGISNSVKSRRVQDCTPGLFWETARSPHVARVCAAIKDAWEMWKRGEMTKEEFEEVKNREKKRLPIFTFHATFKDGRRCNAGAVPSGLSMYDVDHIADPRGFFEEKIRDKAERLGIVLAHVTPSTEGLRLVFVIPRGMDLAGAQKRMSERLGDTRYDASVKDLARSSFAVPEDYILYIDQERLFGNVDNEESPLNEELRMKNVDNEELRMKNEEFPSGRHSSSGGEAGILHSSSQEDSSSSFKGVPYADIIRQWFALGGGEPVQGERNEKLHRLAYHLRYITDNDESLLLRIMPRYGLSEEEMRGLIHSACQAKWGGMPRLMDAALKSLGSGAPEAGREQAPPAMPEKLPALVELLLSRTPDVYKPAVAHAVFPSLAAHLHGVRFRYIDNGEREATLMCVLAAPTGTGKSCVNAPIDHIMADIRARDVANRQREAQWKESNNSKGANKSKESRPEGLVIQWVSADMTNAAFVMRLTEADGHFLYARMDEIEAFDALKGSSRNPQQFVIMRLAFDTGEYGQERVGEKSVSEQVRVRFNWNASSTPGRVQEYFRKVLVDGPVSRINFCTIPEQEIGSEMPVYGSYDAGFDEALRPYIENLTNAEGLVEEPRLTALAWKLYRELNDRAVLTQDRVFDNLSRRALVIGWLKACVLYVAGGCRWEEGIEDFARWSVEYDLWCKLRFFGASIDQAENAGQPARHPGRANMLESLPDVFTKTDLLRLRVKSGMKSEGTGDLLYRWTKRGFIRQTTNDNYVKLKYRSDGTDLDTNG